jgi:integrase/recombinase XerD
LRPCGRQSPPTKIPLFVTIQRKPHVFARTTDKTIYRIIKRTTARATVKQVSPHGLRSTFATTALQHTQLHKVQYALGHADARTTERYDRQRNNLDDNAVDVISFL